MSKITIYHNPKCGTSRNALELIRNSGADPNIIEYLKTPLQREELCHLIQRMQVSVRDILRCKESLYNELDLDNPKWTDEQLIDFIVQHPVLMNRPIVVTTLGAKLCRPAESVLNILRAE